MSHIPKAYKRECKNCDYWSFKDLPETRGKCFLSVNVVVTDYNHVCDKFTFDKLTATDSEG